MKASQDPNPLRPQLPAPRSPTDCLAVPRRLTLPERRTVLQRLGALSLLCALPGLAGCGLSIRTHAVNRTLIVPHVLDATLEQLVDGVASRYNQVQSMSATVEITATTGGEHRGEVKELPSFSGYIILRKPADLHILMLVPVIRSRALEMVSDGKTFRLLIPSKSKAVEGQDTPPVTEQSISQPEMKVVPVAGRKSAAAAARGTAAPPSRNAGLYDLRPNIIRDALLIPALLPDEYVTLTESSRVTPVGNGRKESLEEPDYDLTVLRSRQGHTLERVRVIHIGRASLRPYQQDIYDAAGRIVTTVTYDKFQKFGEIECPASILISRPVDEYTLRIDFSKITLNQKVDDEQFMLKIPDNIPIQKM